MNKSIVILLHLGYWIMYLTLLAILLGLLSIGQPTPLLRNSRGLSFFTAFAILPAAVSFYAFYCMVFPKFLRRKKYISLTLSSLTLSLLSGLLGWLVLYGLWPLLVPRGGPMLTKGGSAAFIVLVLLMSLNAFANGVIALVIRGFISWYNDSTDREELARKNYEMELELVKSRMNPHFLFNTLNNIDELIETDADAASAYLHKLSDIMRFMLYETKTERIDLADELTYIRQYIDLQKIRVANPSYVDFSLTGNPSGKMISPMLFIPFVENAFKYATNIKKGNAIKITITILANEIIFTCRNSRTDNSTANDKNGGLGNSLIQRRLALLYPDAHSLHIIREADAYTIKLNIFPDGH